MRRLSAIDKSLWARVQDVWPHECALYVVEEQRPGPVKVGIANHPMRRLSSLQNGNPRQLFLRAVFCGPREDCKWVEGAVHFRFAGSCLRGEWLAEPLDAILQEISDLCGATS